VFAPEAGSINIIVCRTMAEVQKCAKVISRYNGLRTLGMKCSPLRDQRICCLAVILRCRSLWTVLSVCAVENVSPERRAAA